MDTRDIIQKKISRKKAKEIIEKMENLKFISFEEDDSELLKNVKENISSLVKKTSTPEYTLTVDSENQVKWLVKIVEEHFYNNELLILAPNVDMSIWINVEVENFNLALNELWDLYVPDDFYIVDGKERMLLAIFEEEFQYEALISRI